MKKNYFLLLLAIILLALIPSACSDNSSDTKDDSDKTPPVLTITSPTEGEVITGGNVYIYADATDNKGVVDVQFLVDGKNIGTNSEAPYIRAWLISGLNGYDGEHTIMAVAKDNAGNLGADTVHITYYKQ